MTDPVTVVLGGITIAVISGAVGKYLGNNDKIDDVKCKERREACSNLVLEKIDHLVSSVDDLKKSISNISQKTIK